MHLCLLMGLHVSISFSILPSGFVQGGWGQGQRISGCEWGNVAGVSLRPVIQMRSNRNEFFPSFHLLSILSLLGEGKRRGKRDKLNLRQFEFFPLSPKDGLNSVGQLSPDLVPLQEPENHSACSEISLGTEETSSSPHYCPHPQERSKNYFWCLLSSCWAAAKLTCC